MLSAPPPLPKRTLPIQPHWTSGDVGAAVIALAGITAFVAMVRVPWSYMAGQRNESSYFAFLWVIVALGLVWIVAYILLIVRAVLLPIRRRDMRRGRILLAAALAVLVTAVFPILIVMIPGESGWQQYQRGFEHYATQNVNVQAIRRWHRTLPINPVTVAIPPKQWPAEVSVLGPQNVESLADGAGIILQWGRFGTWGDSRKLFVAPDQTTPPPEDLHHPWNEVIPGLHAATQIPG